MDIQKPAALRRAALPEWEGEEQSLTAVRFAEEQAENKSFFKNEIRQSVFENCRLESCDFESAAFFDVDFLGCSLRNSGFRGAYFERCRFIGCKCAGAAFAEAVFKETAFRQCDLRYALLDRARLTAVTCDECDLSEASLSELRLKKWWVEKCRFIKNNFFKTPLTGVDFSDCELSGLTVSSPPAELRGAVIAPEQAAELIGLLGVRVKK